MFISLIDLPQVRCDDGTSNQIFDLFKTFDQFSPEQILIQNIEYNVEKKCNERELKELIFSHV
jgi:hypothetical protein